MKGGEEVYEHWQVMAAYNAASAWSSQCSRVLHWRRHALSTAAASTWTTWNLPEVSDRIPGKEATVVSAVLLRLRSCTPWNSRTSQWLSYYSGMCSLTTCNTLVLAVLCCTFSHSQMLWHLLLYLRGSGIPTWLLLILLHDSQLLTFSSHMVSDKLLLGN